MISWLCNKELAPLPTISVIIVKLNTIPIKWYNLLVVLHNNAQMDGVCQLWALVQHLTSICKDQDDNPKSKDVCY